MRIHAYEEERVLVPVHLEVGGREAQRNIPGFAPDFTRDFQPSRSWQQEAFAQAILYVLGTINPEATAVDIQAQLAQYHEQNNNFYRALLTAQHDVPTVTLSEVERRFVAASVVNLITTVTEVFKDTYKIAN